MGNYLIYEDIEDLCHIPISERDKKIIRSIYLMALIFNFGCLLYFLIFFHLWV